MTSNIGRVACLRFGAWLLQGAAARCCCQSAVCALEPGCWCAAGCCFRVPLLVLLWWQASPGAVQGAGLLFIFPPRFQAQKGLSGLVCLWASFRHRFGLVLAAFLFCLCYGCSGAASSKSSTSSRKSNAQAVAPAPNLLVLLALLVQLVQLVQLVVLLLLLLWCFRCCWCSLCSLCCFCCFCCFYCFCCWCCFCCFCCFCCSCCFCCFCCFCCCCSCCFRCFCCCCCSCCFRCFCCCWLWPAPRRNPKALRQKCIMTAHAHCFCWFSQVIPKEQVHVDCAQCFLDSIHFLWFAEFIGARNESLQITMLVMWLQRRDVPATQDVPSAAWCELSRQLVRVDQRSTCGGFQADNGLEALEHLARLQNEDARPVVYSCGCGGAVRQWTNWQVEDVEAWIFLEYVESIEIIEIGFWRQQWIGFN